MKYDIGEVVKSKKAHPCGSREWQIIRIGADYKLKCLGCEHIIMIDQQKIEKTFRKITNE